MDAVTTTTNAAGNAVVLDTSAPLEQIQSILNATLARLPNIFLALVVFGIFYFIARGCRALVHQAIQRRRNHRNIMILMGRLAQGLVLFVGFLIAISVVFPSIRAQNIIELFGIGTVAIGFAFRDILQNFLAGLLILINEPFTIGDRIKIRDFEGVVEDIEARATLLRGDDNKRIVVPNASLFTEVVTVLSSDRGEIKKPKEHEQVVPVLAELPKQKAQEAYT